MVRSSDSSSLFKKIMDKILSYISFCFKICAHLSHLFAQPKKVRFNRLSYLKNEPSIKLNHIFIM